MGSWITEKVRRSLVKHLHRSKITEDNALKAFSISIAKAETGLFMLNYTSMAAQASFTPPSTYRHFTKASRLLRIGNASCKRR